MKLIHVKRDIVVEIKDGVVFAVDDETADQIERELSNPSVIPSKEILDRIMSTHESGVAIPSSERVELHGAQLTTTVEAPDYAAITTPHEASAALRRILGDDPQTWPVFSTAMVHADASRVELSSGDDEMSRREGEGATIVHATIHAYTGNDVDTKEGQNS